MSNEYRLHSVILSGGSGTRLWPLSRSAMPKQLLALNGPRTMIQDTVLRAGLPGAAPPILICNDSHRFLVAEQMQEIGVKPGAIVLEPQGRNTAPAAAVAALIAAETDPKGIVLLLPSDHVVTKQAASTRCVSETGWSSGVMLMTTLSNGAACARSMMLLYLIRTADSV